MTKPATKLADHLTTTSAARENVPEGRLGVAQQIVAFIEVLLLGVWLGSMMFFSFGVAPTAFAVLPTRELAGLLVTSTIGKVEILGLVIGPLLILAKAGSWYARPSSKRASVSYVVLVVIMIAAAALSRYWISPKLVALRAAMGGHIDDVPVSDPLRIQFNDLHQYSVMLMSAAMITGLIVLFLTVRSWLRR